VDSIADHAPHSPLPPITLGNIGGNVVTTRIGPGQYAMYAHLKHGSTRVRIGQNVAAGQIIALVGNSGQTTAPHLHFQFTDGSALFGSEGIPYVLRSYTDLGSGSAFEARC
jgi:murein DD-endopeptidase MepM/ murein hydrolase activator NlpD